MSKVIDQIAQQQSGHNHKALAVQQGLIHPAALPCPVVLTGEGQVGLIEGIHGLIDKVLNVAGSCRASHHGRAEGVDGGLDHHVRQREHNALEAGGQADLQDLSQNMPVQLHRLQIQAQRTVLLGQAEDDQPCGHILGDGGGQGDPRYIHIQQNDRNQVQNDVDHARDDQEIQGALGVPLGPQDGGPEVICHGGRHSQKIDPQIDGRLVDHISGRRHPHQKLPGGKEAEHRQDRAADQGHQNGGVDRAAHHVVPLPSQIPGHHHIGAHGEPHKQGHQQVDQGGGGAHRRQGFLPGKPPHHNDISSVKQQL